MQQETLTIPSATNTAAEEWRDIAGYEGLYQVSNLGRVRSLDRDRLQYAGQDSFALHHYKGRILKQRANRYGYYYVILRDIGRNDTIMVHRLVAIAFIPNPANMPVVNHKDENKENNIVRNLEWCDVKYNNTYGTGQLRSGIKRSKKVEQLSMNGEHIAYFYGTMEAGRQTGIHHIRHVCKGTRQSAGGYLWRYAE